MDKDSDLQLESSLDQALHARKDRKLKTGFGGFFGEGEEKLTNMVFVVIFLSLGMTGLLFWLAYTMPPQNPVISFASLFVLLSNISTLGFGFIFGRSQKDR